MYIDICVYLYVRVCTSWFVHMSFNVHMYMCMYVYVYIYIYIRFHICVHMYLYMYVFIYTYTYVEREAKTPQQMPSCTDLPQSGLLLKHRQQLAAIRVPNMPRSWLVWLHLVQNLASTQTSWDKVPKPL